jgi:hypothetical protein
MLKIKSSIEKQAENIDLILIEEPEKTSLAISSIPSGITIVSDELMLPNTCELVRIFTLFASEDISTPFPIDKSSQ